MNENVLIMGESRVGDRFRRNAVGGRSARSEYGGRVGFCRDGRVLTGKRNWGRLEAKPVEKVVGSGVIKGVGLE